MQPIATDEVAWSVGRSVSHDSKPCNTAEPMPFGLWNRVGPMNHILDGVQMPCVKGQWWWAKWGRSVYSKWLGSASTGTVRMPIRVYYMGMHIGATWWIRLNEPSVCVAAMRPYVKLVWPVVITATDSKRTELLTLGLLTYACQTDNLLHNYIMVAQVRSTGMDMAPAEEPCVSVRGKRHVQENRRGLRNPLGRCVKLSNINRIESPTELNDLSPCGFRDVLPSFCDVTWQPRVALACRCCRLRHTILFFNLIVLHHNGSIHTR